MEKKSRKKPVIILIVVAVILVGGLTAGYIAINKMFSVFSDSFYQVSVSEKEDLSAEEQEHQPSAGETAVPEPPEESGQKQENVAPATKPPAQSSVKPSTKLPTNLSSEESKDLMNEVSFSDKLSVISILNENLTAAEYRELAGMLSGGITSDEMKKARKILSKSLDREDKDKILEYYRKYEDLLE